GLIRDGARPRSGLGQETVRVFIRDSPRRIHGMAAVVELAAWISKRGDLALIRIRLAEEEISVCKSGCRTDRTVTPRSTSAEAVEIGRASCRERVEISVGGV